MELGRLSLYIRCIMGTNYYCHLAGEKRHIGKRSAAGRQYCWDCGQTLFAPGEQFVHEQIGIVRRRRFYKLCPKCNRQPEKPCMSFNWAMPEADLQRVSGPITNGYGEVFSLREFLNLLEECPIQYTDSIGEDFC